jgi:hypothetical protein
MKFTHFALLGVATAVLAAGCAGPEQSEPVEETAIVAEEEASAGIEVDEGLFNVDVTVSAGFLDGQAEADIAANAEEAGYTDYVINPDGSVTYTMPKATYEAALQEMRDGVDQTIQETVNESPDVFTSISYDNSMTSFDVTVNRAAYEGDLGAGFIGFTLGISGMFYQMFEGVPTESQQVLISFIDASNNETFDTQKWPLEE